MLILNFAHPLTDEHIQTIEALTGQKVERVIVIDSQIDTQKPLAPQIVAMADAAGLTSEEWQRTATLLISLPMLKSHEDSALSQEPTQI